MRTSKGYLFKARESATSLAFDRDPKASEDWRSFRVEKKRRLQVCHYWRQLATDRLTSRGAFPRNC